MTRIILIGYMGAGKSTLGKQLSKKLGIPFIDSDLRIEELEGKSIEEIFDQKGESYFRTKEAELIHALFAENEFVLSTGGGLPCFNGLMDKLNTLGTTIYLQHKPELLFGRLRVNNSKRPLIAKLNDNELRAYINSKITEREIYYTKAQIILNKEEQTRDEIIRRLRLHQKN